MPCYAWLCPVMRSYVWLCFARLIFRKTNSYMGKAVTIQLVHLAFLGIKQCERYINYGAHFRWNFDGRKFTPNLFVRE